MLENELPVLFSRLTGKAIADELVDGVLTAAAEGIAHLATTTELAMLSNLRMKIPGYPGSEDDQTFSKVTGILEQQNGKNHYLITLTSTPFAAREYIRSQTTHNRGE